MGAEPTGLPGPAVLLSMLRQMYEIRIFEEALYRAFMTEKMPGTVHQAIGMEAVPVGVAHALRTDDLMTSTHRGHGHAIAKGLSLKALMAEMYARKTGVCHGMGGSLHIFDLERGFLGTTGIVGASVPIAVGAALAAQLEGRSRVVVSFFGDGASNQGAVHEALNLAAVWRLPVVFLCENNRYAVSTPVERAIAIPHIAGRATAYGMPGRTIDGNDVLLVHTAAREAVARARSGEGPSLIECETYRYKGHSRFEPAAYRPHGELEAWLAKDPIERLRARLIDEGVVTAEEADAVKGQVEETMTEAVSFARQSVPADASRVASMVFAQSSTDRREVNTNA